VGERRLGEPNSVEAGWEGSAAARPPPGAGVPADQRAPSAAVEPSAARALAPREPSAAPASGEPSAAPATAPVTSPDDTALLARAQRGDLDAYEQLLGRYEEPAYRLAYLLLRDAAEAEDVTQEAFVRAHAALARFRLGEPFRPWLLRIVANQAISARRADRRRGDLVRRLEGEPRPNVEPNPEAATLLREQRDAVLGALAQLRPDDQVVLHLRYFLDLGEAELAATLGCARGTVKSRLHRAQARLRTVLAPLFPDLAAAAGPGLDVGP
jgi:RNA polymerase sigma factor (sigma-70 family)